MHSTGVLLRLLTKKKKNLQNPHPKKLQNPQNFQKIRSSSLRAVNTSVLRFPTGKPCPKKKIPSTSRSTRSDFLRHRMPSSTFFAPPFPNLFFFCFPNSNMHPLQPCKSFASRPEQVILHLVVVSRMRDLRGPEPDIGTLKFRCFL